MSRSYRKTAIVRGCKRCSDKQWRRTYNRKLRRANKIKLQKEQEEFLPKLVREVSNVWDGCRDHTWDFRDQKYGLGEIYFPWTYHWEDGKLLKRAYTEEELEKEREEQRESYRRCLRK